MLKAASRVLFGWHPVGGGRGRTFHVSYLQGRQRGEDPKWDCDECAQAVSASAAVVVVSEARKESQPRVQRLVFLYS